MAAEPCRSSAGHVADQRDRNWIECQVAEAAVQAAQLLDQKLRWHSLWIVARKFGYDVVRHGELDIAKWALVEVERAADDLLGARQQQRLNEDQALFLAKTTDRFLAKANGPSC